MAEDPREAGSPKRAAQRVAPRVAVAGIHVELDRGVGKLVDLSERGMKITCSEPYAVDSTLRATLTAGRQRQRVEGQVRWCQEQENPQGDQRFGIGVQFRSSNPHALQRQILELFMAAGG